MSQGFARGTPFGVDFHVAETLYFTSSGTFDKAVVDFLVAGDVISVEGLSAHDAGTAPFTTSGATFLSVSRW